jgi:hypothetical protein
MERVINQERFHGGLSEDERDGTANTFFWGRALDLRSKPSVLRILPKTAKESGTTVVDLVKWFEPVGTDMYSYGDAGKFYKRTSGASWSLIDTLTTSSGNGMAYFPLDDYIYLPKDKVIARYGPIGGTPALTQDYFTDGTVDLDQFLDTSGQTYSTATSINEGATHRQTFDPQKDPQVSVQINVNDTGDDPDWTVTVHDQSNNVMATKTITFASMSTGDVTFTFATPWRPVIGATYHFHVTTSTTTGAPKVVTGTTADLETADFHTFYQILVTDTDFHPAIEFNGLMCIGNERYLATCNGIDKAAGATVYDPHRIVLPSGWKIRDLEKVGEYLAIVAVRSNTVTEFDVGLIAFWDGTEANYNFYYFSNDGAVTAARGEGSTLFFITTSGNFYAWFNGEVQKIKTIPKMTLQTYVEVFPGAFSSWRGLQMIGVAANSDNTSIEKGVYSYGRLNDKYPRALNYDYPISTGRRTGTTRKIGAVGGTTDTLFISWYDDDDANDYGVDVVTSTAQPFTSAILETLITDDSRSYKRKKTRALKVVHSALISGQSVQLGYKRDRASSYTNDTANSTVGSTSTYYTLDELFYYELQAQVTYVTSGANNLETKSVAILFDDMSETELLRDD